MRIAQPIENLVIHRRVAEQLELVRIEQLVHHLITRAERVEMPAQSGTEQAAQASMARPTLNVPAVATPGASAHGPIAQVVRRNGPQPRGDESPADLERNSGRLDAWPQVMNGTRHPAASEALDLSRLTDQVIQAIDRRIIAQRERLGRA